MCLKMLQAEDEITLNTKYVMKCQSTRWIKHICTNRHMVIAYTTVASSSAVAVKCIIELNVLLVYCNVICDI